MLARGTTPRSAFPGDYPRSPRPPRTPGEARHPSWESFTPDNQFIAGEAPGLRNFFVGAGFNSVGIASAGGPGGRWPSGSSPATRAWT